MNEWRKVKLKEVINYASRGITPKYSENLEGIIVLNQKCIRNQKLNLNESRLHADYLKKVSQEKIIQKYDILINSTGVGTLGRVCQNNFNEKMTFDSHITIIRPNRDKINPLFLGYFLKNQQSFIESLGEGSTGQTELKRDRLINELEVKFPLNMQFQEKIVKILFDIDEKIELNNKINDNLEKQAQLIFKSWFIDFEPFNKKTPLDWDISTLGEITNLMAGGDKPQNFSDVKTKKYNVPIFSNGIIKNGLYGYTNTAKIFDESVTVSARGTIGFVCLRETPYVPIVRLISIIPKNNIISSKYLYLWLKNINIQGTGSTQQQLTIPEFKKTKILIPNEKNMKKFTLLVKPLFENIKNNQIESEKLTNLKNCLLPKLMNGEIDVENIEL